MGYASIAIGLGLGGGKSATSNGRSNVASESFTTATLSATDLTAFSVNNTYTLTVRPSTAIAAGGSISIVGLTGSTTGNNGSLTVAGANAAVFGSSGAWTQSSGTLVLTVAGGQSIPTGSDTVITFVIANPNSVTAGVSSVTLTSSGFSASSLAGTFLNAVAIFNVTTRNTEANILASTPTNPSGEVNIAFGTDTGDFYIYNGSAWYIYNDTPFNVYSISLDGTDDYIDCGGDSDFSFTDGSGNDSAFSISAWVKLDGNNRTRVVGKGNVEWLFGTNASNKLSLYLWSNDTTTAYIAQEENTALATGDWHHIVATYDGSNNASGIKIYRAGSLVTMSNASSGSYAGMASQQGALRIGEWELNASVMDGLVDEVAVFNSELSASDITSIYNGGNPSDISSLNPLGWWRMGDNNSGIGTTVTDRGSGGNNGTLTNGATFSTDIPYALPLITNQYSVDLDGTDDYIDCGGASTFSFTDGSGSDSAFSISAWVKLDSASIQRIVDKSGTTQASRSYLFGTDGDSKFNLFLGPCTGNYLYVRESSPLSTGVWYHLVATYDGSNTEGGMTLYRNGAVSTLQLLSSGSYAGMPSDSNTLKIGRLNLNASVMNGLVDEVAVFNSELSASDVSNIYNSGVPADISSLNPLAWYRMGDNNSGAGTTITDQGSGGNNGTLTNGPTFSTTVPS